MENVVTLETLIDYADDYLEASEDAREIAERCRAYYDGDQYTSDEITILKARNQPIVVNNRIQPMVDFLVGMEIAARTDPKAYARTPKHEYEADAVTDALRYVQDKERFDSISTDVFEEFLIEGMGGVSVEWDKKNKEVKIRHIPPDRMIVDLHVRERQIENDRYRGVVTWMDIEDVRNRWGDIADEVAEDARAAFGHAADTMDDVPVWYDAHNRKRVMVVEMYFRHNAKWHRAVFTKGHFLEEAAPSPYKDQNGDGVCPFILASPKVKRKTGGRYGLVATRLSMQDSINKRQSKATDLLNRKQTWSKKGALDNVDDFKAQANDSGGHMEFPAMGKFGDDFGIVENESLAGPQFQMYKDDIAQMEAIKNGGMTDDNSTNLSGKALRTLQQGRSLEVSPIREVYHQWLIRVSTAVWERIRQFWKEETWVRVTDDDANVRFVGLNRNKTIRDQIIEEMGQIPEQVLQNPQMVNLLDQEIRGPDGKSVPMNKLAALDVDIVLEEAPDVLTLQQEVFETLAEMWQSNPEAIPYQKIIEVAPLPRRWKDQLLTPPQVSPEQQAEQERQQQVAEASVQADMAAKQAKTAKDQASAVKEQQEAVQTAIENRILSLYRGEPTQVNI